MMIFVIRLAAIVMVWLTASLASATDLENLTDGERQALRAEIRSYLLENPDIIVEVIGILERRREQDDAKAALSLVSDNAEQIFNDGFSYVGYNPDGDITMVEFLDYRCGFCKRAHKNVHTLLKADPGIRYIVKEFPILGPDSELASQAAIAILMTQGDTAYAAFNDAVMRFNGPINLTSLSGIASDLGLDESAMADTMDSEEVARRISATRRLGDVLRINGTPTFIIGDEIIRGFLTLEQMVEVVGAGRLAQK